MTGGTRQTLPKSGGPGGREEGGEIPDTLFNLPYESVHTEPGLGVQSKRGVKILVLKTELALTQPSQPHSVSEGSY